jgi:hypothetical protein
MIMERVQVLTRLIARFPTIVLIMAYPGGVSVLAYPLGIGQTVQTSIPTLDGRITDALLRPLRVDASRRRVQGCNETVAALRDLSDAGRGLRGLTERWATEPPG